jgi:hypothetical protein
MNRDQRHAEAFRDLEDAITTANTRASILNCMVGQVNNREEAYLAAFDLIETVRKLYDGYHEAWGEDTPERLSAAIAAE